MPRRVAHPLQEFPAVQGGAAGLRRHQPRPRDAARAHLVPADAQRIQRARNRGFGKAPRLRKALAEPDDAGKCVDDAESVLGRPRDQQPAIVRAQVQRRVKPTRNAARRRCDEFCAAEAFGLNGEN